MNDRMIHSKVISEKNNIDQFFYVFMDFKRGEEHDMMKHAAEFRFYLDSYGNNLSFSNDKRLLNRIGFTELVLKDYLLYKPNNPQEVLTRIRENSNKDESNLIFSTLIKNDDVRQFIL